MKKLVFVAVVLAMTMGIFGTSQAFWPFKKASKASVIKEDVFVEAAAIKSNVFNENDRDPSIKIVKNNGEKYSVVINGALVKTVVKSGQIITGFGAELTLGSFKIDLVIKTDENTNATRRFDGKGAQLSDIKEDHMISFLGELGTSTQTSLVVNAKKIQDFSIQKRDTNFSGVITATTTNGITIEIANENKDRVFIKTSLNTKIVVDGHVSDIQKIKNGMRVVRTSGLLDTSVSPISLEAKEVVIKSNNPKQKEVKSEGAIIREVISSTLVKVEAKGGKIYNLNFDQKTSFYKWISVDGKPKQVLSSLSELNLKEKDYVWFDGVINLDDKIVNVSGLTKAFISVAKHGQMY